MLRRHGRPPRAGQRYRHRPGVYAILPRDGMVLMTWQGGIHDEVQLPGGGIDPGESPVAALHREVFEETGWRIAVPRRLGAFRRFAYMPEYDLWAEKLCHIYLARPTLRLGPPSEPDHLPLWMAPREAARMVAVDGDAAFLREVFRLPS